MQIKSISLVAITELIGAKYIGDKDFEVTGINEIHMVKKGDLTFVDHPKYYEKALNSAATTILIDKEVECPVGKNLIISSKPFIDYNFLTQYFRPIQQTNERIAANAKIGEGTVIRTGAFIGEHVTIGKNCTIHANVVIYDYTQIGDDVEIHANAVIGADAFYFKKFGDAGFQKMYSCGSVIIHNHVTIGACSTLDKGVSGNTIIGEHTRLDNHVHIGHDTIVGKRVLMAAQVAIAGVSIIEDDVILWGQVGVNKDLTIGKGAIVFGQSGVVSSIAGGKNYWGTPAVDARTQMKQIALTKQLPSMFDKLKNLFKD